MSESSAAHVSEPGASAFGEAVQLDLDIACVRRQLTSLLSALRELRDRQSRFRAGAEGEQRVVRVLVDLADTGWTLLVDRRRPGTRRANIDVLLAGPGGVFVIDVKRWRDVRVDGGTLWHGDAPAHLEVEALVAQTAAVQGVLAEQGLAPGEVTPLMVLAGRRAAPTRLGAVHLLGEHDLNGFLLRRGRRLSAEQIAQVATALERSCPPMMTTPAARAVRAVHPGRQQELLTTDEVWRGLVDAAAREPIEAWMTWLHPSQARLVTRSWSGPARIRGAAGTGKTVVALHRARHLALSGRRVLFASYVGTLAPVFRSLFERLAPDLSGRVTFASVHAVAVRLLRSTGVTVAVDDDALADCFARAWCTVREGSPLADLGVPPSYWREEIAHIKGRGIADAADYAAVARHGRRVPLQPAHRRAVWELFGEYERRRLDRGLVDWDDVLAMALDATRRGAGAGEWDAVIVDEVQDLTCTGLRLLHAVGGDGPDGLLLVGDARQSIFPGGVTPAEAGVSVAGRGVVLERNYRNGAHILRHALELVGADPFDDLEPLPSGAGRAVQATRLGGLVVRAEGDGPASQRLALLTYLGELREQEVRYGDIAVLVPTNEAARAWRDALRTASVPAMLLADYDGTARDEVKVGTFERSKGLDFAHVLIPDSDAIPGPRRPHESAEAYAERAALERRRMYVGQVRARDGLWLGTTHLEGR